MSKSSDFRNEGNTTVGETDNFMRVGVLYSTADANESFTFDTPFSTTDGTTDADIEVILQRKDLDNPEFILAPKSITVTGFSVNRANGIDGSGTDEPFTYIAFNKSQLAKGVVYPDLLAVEDNEVVEGVYKSVNRTTTDTWLDGGRTWQDLKNEYQDVRVDFEGLTTGGNIFKSNVIVDAARITANDSIRATDGTGTENSDFNFEFEFGTLTTGDAQGKFPDWQTMTVRVVGIKSQKTVVNTNDADLTVSATEVNTNQTWIDGKTIYRKALQPATGGLNQTNFIGELPDADKAISAKAVYKSSGNAHIENMHAVIDTGNGGDVFFIHTNTDLSSVTDLTFVLEYTK